MDINSIAGGTPVAPKQNDPVELTRRQQKQTKDIVNAESSATPQQSQQSQPEELLQQIKSITDDGVYSIQFENYQDTNELVVKVIDRETNEVIRQIPPEELLELTKNLQEMQGNLVNTVS